LPDATVVYHDDAEGETFSGLSGFREAVALWAWRRGRGAGGGGGGCLRFRG
jgi:hypothetical protein